MNIFHASLIEKVFSAGKTGIGQIINVIQYSLRMKADLDSVATLDAYMSGISGKYAVASSTSWKRTG